jgi:hypothetical protein
LGGSQKLRLFGGAGTEAYGNWDFSTADSIDWGTNIPVAVFG